MSLWGILSGSQGEYRHFEGTAISADNTVSAPIINQKAYGVSVQRGIPSPDMPIPIQSLGEGGGLDVLVAGKNLFDKKHVSILNAYIDSNLRVIGIDAFRMIYIPCEPNTTYTLSKPGNLSVGESSAIPQIGAYVTQRVTAPAPNEYIRKSATITTTGTARYLCAFVYNTNLESMGLAYHLDRLQIEKGSEMTAYQPCVGQTTYQIGLAERDPIRGIAGWISDQIDWQAGRIMRNVGRTAFTGSEMVEQTKDASLCAVYKYYFSAVTGDFVDHSARYLCNWFPMGIKNDVMNGVSEGIVADGVTQAGIGMNAIYVSILKSRLIEVSTTGFRQFLTEKAAEGSPLTIYYKRSGKQEQIHLPSMVSVNGQTNISVPAAIGTSRMEADIKVL